MNSVPIWHMDSLGFAPSGDIIIDYPVFWSWPCIHHDPTGSMMVSEAHLVVSFHFNFYLYLGIATNSVSSVGKIRSSKWSNIRSLFTMYLKLLYYAHIAVLSYKAADSRLVPLSHRVWFVLCACFVCLFCFCQLCELKLKWQRAVLKILYTPANNTDKLLHLSSFSDSHRFLVPVRFVVQ